MAVERGRSTRPDICLGVCGEHGGDPVSIGFFDKVRPSPPPRSSNSRHVAHSMHAEFGWHQSEKHFKTNLFIHWITCPCMLLISHNTAFLCPRPCFQVGLDYVSCSPLRLPIARLAAAQASIKAMRAMETRPAAAAHPHGPYIPGGA